MIVGQLRNTSEGTGFWQLYQTPFAGMLLTTHAEYSFNMFMALCDPTKSLSLYYTNSEPSKPVISIQYAYKPLYALCIIYLQMSLLLKMYPEPSSATLKKPRFLLVFYIHFLTKWLWLKNKLQHGFYNTKSAMVLFKYFN